MTDNLISKDALFLSVFVGNAKDQDDNEYELLTMANSNPAVRSKKTGITYFLSWQEILTMAIKAGVNNE